MDFRQTNEHNNTPKDKPVGKVLNTPKNCESSLKFLQAPSSCDSPFRILPNISSTPPSRFTKIRNPFEAQLMERLHLPTFSPSVFTQMSTPKSSEKFKWTIDHVSSLKPADIDEETIQQHIFEQDQDPMIESMVQDKIQQFFSEKVIVPSPMTQLNVRPALVTIHEEKYFCDNTAQTVLSLPPTLPRHIEEALAPYFSYHVNQQQPQQFTNADIDELNQESSLYKHLFDPSPTTTNSQPHHSPPSPVDLSPLKHSPLPPLGVLSPMPSEELSPLGEVFSSPSEHKRDRNPGKMLELRDCSLSPIGGSVRSPIGGISSRTSEKLVCRFSFSEVMSVDNSVPSAEVNERNVTQYMSADQPSMNAAHEISSESLNSNLDMEYKHVSLISSENSSDSNRMEVSIAAETPHSIPTTTGTPHSKLFTSQRKRLSESFRDDDNSDSEYKEKTKNSDDTSSRKPRSRLFKDDVVESRLLKDDDVESGYHTGTLMSSEEYSWKIEPESYLFASTPTKIKN